MQSIHCMYFKDIYILQIDECMTELGLVMSIFHVVGSFWLWLYAWLYKSGLKCSPSWSTLCEIHLSPWVSRDQKLRFESGTQAETGSDVRPFIKPTPAYIFGFCVRNIHTLLLICYCCYFEGNRSLLKLWQIQNHNVLI